MAEISAVVLARLASAHQQGLSRIQIAAEAAAMDAWYATGYRTPDPEDDEQDEGMSKLQMATWAAAFWLVTRPAIEAVNRQSYEYMSAMNSYLGISAPLPMPNTDWFRIDFEGWALSPAFRSGPPNEVAKHVSKLVSATTRRAELNAMDSIIESDEWKTTREYIDQRPDDYDIADSVAEAERIAEQAAAGGFPTAYRSKAVKRWKRIPQADACGWCQVLSDKLLTDEGVIAHKIKSKSGDGGKWHNYCRCVKRLTSPQEARAFEPRFADGGYTDIINRRFVEEQQGDE